MTKRMQGIALFFMAAAVTVGAAGLGARDALSPSAGNMDLVQKALSQVAVLESRQRLMLDRKKTLETEADAAVKAESAGNLAAEFLREDLFRDKALAGLTALEGAGVRVTLTDASRAFIASTKPGADAGVFIVHEQDILRIINALWCAGAEAVAINGVRIGSLDAVRCVGPSVMVGERRLAPPFLIEAIGDGTLMKTDLTTGSHAYLYQELAAFGIGIEIDVIERLVLPGREEG